MKKYVLYLRCVFVNKFAFFGIIFSLVWIFLISGWIYTDIRELIETFDSELIGLLVVLIIALALGLLGLTFFAFIAHGTYRMYLHAKNSLELSGIPLVSQTYCGTKGCELARKDYLKRNPRKILIIGHRLTIRKAYYKDELEINFEPKEGEASD